MHPLVMEMIADTVAGGRSVPPYVLAAFRQWDHDLGVDALNSLPETVLDAARRLVEAGQTIAAIRLVRDVADELEGHRPHALTCKAFVTSL